MSYIRILISPPLNLQILKNFHPGSARAPDFVIFFFFYLIYFTKNKSLVIPKCPPLPKGGRVSQPWKIGKTHHFFHRASQRNNEPPKPLIFFRSVSVKKLLRVVVRNSLCFPKVDMDMSSHGKWRYFTHTIIELTSWNNYAYLRI